MKLATVLSAMQIGDITRQRIEHCQLAFRVLSEYLQTPEGMQLKADQRDRLWLLIRQLVSQQLEETHADFHRDTSKIVSTVASFDAEIRHILDLGTKMKPVEGDASGSIIRQLEANIEKAKQIVHEVEAGAMEADALCQSTEAIVTELLQSIEVVKVVRTDIQYMALNTNLRCSKIGEEGRAINVITAELRNFAGLMDGTAEHILVSLQSLQTTATRMRNTNTGTTNDERLEYRLASASDNIHAAADQMDASLKNLDEQGRSAAKLMKTAIPQLDFNAELGEILAECTALSAPDSFEIPSVEDIAPALEELVRASTRATPWWRSAISTHRSSVAPIPRSPLSRKSSKTTTTFWKPPSSDPRGLLGRRGKVASLAVRLVAGHEFLQTGTDFGRIIPPQHQIKRGQFRFELAPGRKSSEPFMIRGWTVDCTLSPISSSS